MGESLIPLFCVAEVSAETLSSIIETAYAGSPDSPPSIIVLCEPASLTNLKTAQPSRPPVTNLSSYPFLSHSIQDLATFLDSNSGPAISSHQFLIADKQTNENHSVLFVDRGYEPGQTPETVRLDAEHANAVPVAVQVATMGTNEVRAQVDEDGVFRGGASRPAVRKGQPTPRKTLGGGDSG
ncbi:hypothetical protein MMC29_006246 [Sticta canariensis]|nr:hypothetical protein [Sticta canariensis]